MQIIVLGNGVAGTTAAREARQRAPHARVTLVSEESPYFFSRTALMYAFMDRLTRRDLEPFERHVYERERIARVHERAVDLDANAQTLTLAGGATLRWDRLILATGAVPRGLDVPGLREARSGVVHFVSLADLDACEALTPSTREAVVVGGGLIGIELVECLAHHGVRTTFLLRDDHYWPTALPTREATLVGQRLEHHGVTLLGGDTLAAVETDGEGRVAAVITARGRRLPAQMLGVCVGVRPQVDFLREARTPPEIRGGILVDEQLRTSLPQVWACGDCAAIQLPDAPAPLVETMWYSAKRQGTLAGANATGASLPYQRPLFVNSAMLVDLSYTAVGRSTAEGTTLRTLVRQHRRRPATQRIFCEGEQAVGFLMLGSSWDTERLSRWVAEARSVDWVRAHLASAQYDVELGPLDLRDAEEAWEDWPPVAVGAAHIGRGT